MNEIFNFKGQLVRTVLMVENRIQSSSMNLGSTLLSYLASCLRLRNLSAG